MARARGLQGRGSTPGRIVHLRAMNRLRDALVRPPRLWTPEEALSAGGVPASAGSYAWFFRSAPPGVPLERCATHRGAVLLYLGIAPSRAGSASTLRKRLRSHLRGNASGSTLRLSLGCLLADTLGIELRRVGRTRRLTFASGEAKLTDWLARNALLAWVQVDRPWRFEANLIHSLSLPLNLDMNEAHPFQQRLSMLRRAARARARELPVLSSSRHGARG